MLTKGKKRVYLRWNSATFFQLGAGILINRQLQKAVNPKANLCLSKSLIDIFAAHTRGFLYACRRGQQEESSPQRERFGWERGLGERSRCAGFHKTLPSSSLGHILINLKQLQTCYPEPPKQADFAFHCLDHHREY